MPETKRQACIVTVTPAPDEPRLLRQASVLEDAGWDVTVVGFAGRQAAPSSWRFIQINPVYRARRLRDRARLAADRAFAPAIPFCAEDYYWRYAYFLDLAARLIEVEHVRCDLAIGHDIYTAPIAARVAKASGGRFSVDCHEFAIEQYMHDSAWIRRERPWIRALERRFLSRAALVTTVCDGIADAYRREYRLAHRPTVIRSMARLHDLAPRAPGDRLTVLYHGIVSPTRGLEDAIESVALWRGDHRLIIRGPGEADYVAQLRGIAERCGVAQRVSVEDGVPYGEMVPKANEADIGLFVQGGFSIQKRYTLPNKFFEYVQARLALCVSDLPEMAKLVREHDLGMLVPQPQPQAIADAINALTPERVAHYKARSHVAAATLCWENEAKVLADAYERAANPG